MWILLKSIYLNILSKLTNLKMFLIRKSITPVLLMLSILSLFYFYPPFSEYFTFLCSKLTVLLCFIFFCFPATTLLHLTHCIFLICFGKFNFFKWFIMVEAPHTADARFFAQIIDFLFIYPRRVSFRLLFIFLHKLTTNNPYGLIDFYVFYESTGLAYTTINRIVIKKGKIILHYKKTKTLNTPPR